MYEILRNRNNFYTKVTFYAFAGAIFIGHQRSKLLATAKNTETGLPDVD